MRNAIVAIARLAFVAGFVQAPMAYGAGGVVGTGTAASCTEAAFDAIFFKAQSSGGGIITFNCGAAPHAIVLGAYKGVATPTEIAGGGLVTLSGGNTAGLFQVSTNAALKLSAITITRGLGAFGAIENFGTLTVVDSRLEVNTSTVHGGALTNHGEATLANVVVSGNTAAQFGGGIYTDGGTLTITGSDVVGNLGANGGGIYVAAGAIATVATTQVRMNETTVNIGQGGGIRSAGTLAVADSTFAQNKAHVLGGALSTFGGSATLSRSALVLNVALGGAAIAHTGGSLAVNQSNIAGNGFDANGLRVTESGGGLLHDLGGTVTMTNVSITGNRATTGAGVANYIGAITLTNVTLNVNRSDAAGGTLHLVNGSATLTNVSILDNIADSAGGVLTRTGGTLTLKNTVLANPGSLNCKAPVAGATFSLSSDDSCGFGVGRDSRAMQFEAIAFNDGFTLTQLPLAGNPVIDNGTGVGCPATDQRGVTRPSGLACDVGAVEFVAGAPATATVIEFFNASFGHYFVSLLPDEILKLDAGLFVGWTRTGQQFNVYRDATPGLVAVCRFFTTAFAPKSSHFYAPRGFGCEGTLANNDWQFEADVFYTVLPSASGSCPSGQLPVYRLYNNGQGGAPNHRFTTSPTIRTQMLARGYVPEGAGIGVGMCSPQ